MLGLTEMASWAVNPDVVFRACETLTSRLTGARCAIAIAVAAISAAQSLCKNEVICMAHKDLHGITMKNIYRSLFLILVGATQKELARQIRYLKVENEVLRSKLPYRVLDHQPGAESTGPFRRQAGAGNQPPGVDRPPDYPASAGSERIAAGSERCRSARGRRRTAEQIRRLIVKLGRETGWGYTRILGELKKLGHSLCFAKHGQKHSPEGTASIPGPDVASELGMSS